MSESKIPASNSHYKPLHILDENLTLAEVYGPMRVGEPWPLPPQPVKPSQPPVPAAKPPRRRPPRPRRSRPRSGQITPYQAKRAAMEDLPLHSLRRDGFTPYFGKKKRFLMTPPEFTLVLAFEPREVAQVIHEVLLQLVGYPGDSADGRREWVVLSQRHFERRGIMSQAKAQRTLTYAVERGYLLRRRRGPQQWEYGVHYRQVDNGTGEPVENFSN